MAQNKKMNNKLGFTLIEILFVISIIGILVTLGLTSYSKVLTNSRDSTRKTDLQSISSALEQYKSNDSFGSYPITLYGNSDFEKYMTSVPTPYPTGYNPIPTDPKTMKNYVYIPLPTGCVPSSNNCTDYSLGASLEMVPDKVCSFQMTCTDTTCNYCIGPYGEK